MSTLNRITLSLILICGLARADIVSRIITFSDGSILTASDLNTEFNNVVDGVNNITNDNIANSAAISPVKINASIAGNGLGRDSGTGALSVNVDASSITIAADTLSSHGIVPERTVYTTGSGTYTVPTGAKWLEIELVGGGGGGGGSGTGGNGGSGAVGSVSTFGDASGAFGTGGVCANGASGAGGAATLGTGVGIAIAGGDGGGGQNASGGQYTGGAGCSSQFGGAGMPVANLGGSSAKANTGSGGGGGSNSGTTGAGGGCGGYVKKVITSSLAATYTYAVGQGGVGGTAGTGGSTGGDGGSGLVIVTAHF